MGARVSWQTLVTARATAIVEGTSPATGVSGRSITAGLFKATLMHGDLNDPSFPAAHFHRGYLLGLGDVEPVEPFNPRAGIAKFRTRLRVSVGYLIGRSAPRRAAGVGTALRSAEDTGADDLWALVNGLCWPAFWGTLNASPLLGLYAINFVRSAPRELVDRERVVRDTDFDLGVSLVPGGVYA
jgi:hypothetical protein